ncbi:hypothetical protein GPECTOR_28g851 [Gonium pectorale]|uniref:HD/PDEase domain-containing protein n=1 Tax=Gonium pectorale TaxID=33097 RepID=A0A150GF03_GONPE|nr:hypothetical protein GPECTOR_28g851 [Gonium pectorale]|eukprot:KXZ48441.1 hypothetical protein GPECTOR_28g851 [Gonium pectorale]
MVDAMRAMLDELMGKERNVPLSQRSNRRIHYDDPTVCKYERRLMKELDSLIREMDRKIAKAKERAEAESMARPLKPEDAARLAEMQAKAKELLHKSQEAGEAGDVDVSMALAQQAQEMQTQHDRLHRSLTAPERTMSVCDICGVFINSTDNDQRRQEHLTGKQYLGWKAIREKYAELQNKYERARSREPEPFTKERSGPPEEPSHRSSSRDRERERDRERSPSRRGSSYDDRSGYERGRSSGYEDRRHDSGRDDRGYDRGYDSRGRGHDDSRGRGYDSRGYDAGYDSRGRGYDDGQRGRGGGYDDRRGYDARRPDDGYRSAGDTRRLRGGAYHGASLWFTTLCALSVALGALSYNLMAVLAEFFQFDRRTQAAQPRTYLHGVDVTSSRFFRIPAVLAAVEFAAEAHRHQRRKTGQPYVSHCIETALIVEACLPPAVTSAEQDRHVACIMTAVLHDVLDDTPTDPAAMAAAFGPRVAGLVGQVSKLSQMNQLLRRGKRQYSPDHFKQLRKLIVDLAFEEPLVVLVKLADRLHNMRTVYVLAPDKAASVADETLEVWCSMAESLGWDGLKSEMEDLCFAVLQPSTYCTLRSELDRLWSLPSLAVVEEQLGEEEEGRRQGEGATGGGAGQDDGLALKIVQVNGPAAPVRTYTRAAGVRAVSGRRRRGWGQAGGGEPLPALPAPDAAAADAAVAAAAVPLPLPSLPLPRAIVPAQPPPTPATSPGVPAGGPAAAAAAALAPASAATATAVAVMEVEVGPSGAEQARPQPPP